MTVASYRIVILREITASLVAGRLFLFVVAIRQVNHELYTRNNQTDECNAVCCDLHKLIESHVHFCAF